MTDHAILRAHERYGVTLTAADIAKIGVRCLRLDNAVIIHVEPDRKSYLLSYNGVAMRPVVRDDDGTVLTFLASQKQFTQARNKRMARRCSERDEPRRVKKLSVRDCGGED